MTYEKMWEVIMKLSRGHARKWVARETKVPLADVERIAADYDVGRRMKAGCWTKGQAAATHWTLTHKAKTASV